MNQLDYGDHLQVLRKSVAEESVDLIYLDPPFDSKRDDNLLFKSPKGGGQVVMNGRCTLPFSKWCTRQDSNLKPSDS